MFIFTNRRRQANLQKGKQLLREGKITEARECFTRSVNITPSMAHDVIRVRSLYLKFVKEKKKNIYIVYVVK